MQKLLLIILLGFSFCGCDPVATFTNPQPENTNSLRIFPTELQGTYKSEDNKTTLKITQSLITANQEFYYSEHKDSMDKFYNLRGDTLFNTNDHSFEQVAITGDSITRHIQNTDTLFILDNQNILKRYKSFYFLNSLLEKNKWEVKKLAFTGTLLNISAISEEEDLKKLKELSGSRNDTSSNNFQLNKKKFKAFIKQGGFSSTEVFSRIAD